LFSSFAFAEDGYKLGPDDIIIIKIFAGGKVRNKATLTISDQGLVSVPFLGEIKCKGRTVDELTKIIRKGLVKDYFVDPVVNIKAEKSISLSKIYVMGRVKNPKAYDFQEGLTVLNACIIAGGFDPFAAPNRTTITRIENGKKKIIKINLKKVRDGKEKDILLKPRDRIYIPESKF
jgi:protein involved in polysaccharide export with SLBB domain